MVRRSSVSFRRTRLSCWSTLHCTRCSKISLRTLVTPPQEEVDRLLKLPEDDPAVIAFEDKVMADRVVFGSGRIIADDLGELLVLSGNGYGIGAYKILRAGDV